MHVPILFRNRAVGFALACAGFLFLGWSSLAIPSLVRQVEPAFGQDDAGLGAYYFLSALTYVLGSLAGGAVSGRVGLRTVLVGGLLLAGGGLLVQGVVASWAVFLGFGVLRGAGSGVLDGSLSAMVLDLFPDQRGRALNIAHLFFALGAFVAPLAFGLLVDGGVPWPLLLTATGVAPLLIAVPLAVTDLSARPHPAEAHRRVSTGRLWLAPPIIALSAAIGMYVASEMGVSSWLVRFLAAAPLSTATGALGLFWGGLMLGRLASARFADRFDHLALATVAAVVSAVALALAIVVPVLPVSIALFVLVGFAYGPIYPLIMVVAGERYPGRTASVSGILTAAGVLGQVLYPPVMGVMSVTVGIVAAMAGTVVIGLACAGALVIAGRLGPAPVADPAAPAA
jgi:OFA family oxalate/formate antiporter-like MFS transporter